MRQHLSLNGDMVSRFLDFWQSMMPCRDLDRKPAVHEKKLKDRDTDAVTIYLELHVPGQPEHLKTGWKRKKEKERYVYMDVRQRRL